jgi:hypothetical protein
MDSLINLLTPNSDRTSSTALWSRILEGWKEKNQIKPKELLSLSHGCRVAALFTLNAFRNCASVDLKLSEQNCKANSGVPN